MSCCKRRIGKQARVDWTTLKHPCLQPHNPAGECNQALAQQALVLREHLAQRDAETAALVSELQSARVRPHPASQT